MPRHRVRTTTTGYKPEDIPKLVALVQESGRSVTRVAREHGVPRQTLRRWVTNPPPKLGAGGKTVLSFDEECTIATALEFLSKCGFPQGRNEVKDMVQSYIEAIGRKTPFTNNRPGDDWMRLYEQRHADVLKRRKPEILTLARAKGLTVDVVNGFFDMYEEVLRDNGLSDQPHRIFNLDETGLNTDRRSDAVFVSKKTKDAYIKCPTAGKTMFSVLFCVSATGIYLAPFTVYKAKHLYQTWTEGGPQGAAYSCSDSGWMMDTNFESWFSKIFVPHVASLQKPVLLTFDGHNSHLTFNTVKLAIDNNIVILCLPPNTSHALQPLDVGVFRAVKVTWRKILNSWFTESRMQSVDKAVFPRLLGRLWPQLQASHGINAFKGAGLYPADREAVMHRVLHTSEHPPSAATPHASTSTLTTSASTGSSSTITTPTPDTPRKLLRDSIIHVISPEPSESTVAATKQKARKRARVQASKGEVLTNSEVVQRLKTEAEKRLAKQKGATKPKESEKSGETPGTAEKTVKASKVKAKRSLEFADSSESEVTISSSSSDMSTDNESEEEETKEVRVQDLQEDVTFVIVKYEGSYFPGKVVKIKKNGVTVSCMARSGMQAWKWAAEDVHHYPIEDIICTINPPSSSGTRGQCSVPEVEKYW